MATCAEVRDDDYGYGLVVTGFEYGNTCRVPMPSSQQVGRCCFIGGMGTFEKRLQLTPGPETYHEDFVYARCFLRHQQI
jgi:hypothetical protein